MMTEKEFRRIRVVDEVIFSMELEDVIDNAIIEAVEETEPSLKDKVYAKVWRD